MKESVLLLFAFRKVEAAGGAELKAINSVWDSFGNFSAEKQRRASYHSLSPRYLNNQHFIDCKTKKPLVRFRDFFSFHDGGSARGVREEIPLCIDVLWLSFSAFGGGS